MSFIQAQYEGMYIMMTCIIYSLYFFSNILMSVNHKLIIKYRLCFLLVNENDLIHCIQWTSIRKTLKPGSVPSVFAWKGEVTPRREILRHPLPQKRPREENEEVFPEETCETVYTDG